MSQSARVDQDTFDSIQESASWRSESPARFKTTQWNVVLAAGHGPDGAAESALEEVCRAYWFPLYAFVRRYGHSPEDAQDLTQEFFARFLGKNYFARADRRRGKFRTFLLASLKHFLTEEWRRGSRQKRGGGQALIAWDELDAERRYAAAPGAVTPPDLAFERDWAEALLQKVLDQLHADCASTGRREMYEQLLQFLWGPGANVSYAQIGERLHMNEGTVKVAVHRLRRRFRDLLREELSRNVASPSEVDDELRHILKVFSS